MSVKEEVKNVVSNETDRNNREGPKLIDQAILRK